MSTEKQIAANRRNALLSTGPKTPGGKAASRRNALKHGLRSSVTVLPGESRQSFGYLFRAMCDELQPVGRLERILVEQMAIAYWKLGRITSIESKVFASNSEPDNLFRHIQEAYLGRPVEPPPDRTPEQRIADAFMRDTASFNTFSRLSYYEMRLERSFYRAHRELRRLQSRRLTSP